MYEYHSKLDATHPFSSLWYTWPVMYRPVWLYTITYPNGIHSTISTVGNVAIWWGGIVGVLYSIYRLVRKKEKFGIIIIAVLLCLYLPYSMIGRCMFLYHYFPVFLEESKKNQGFNWIGNRNPFTILDFLNRYRRIRFCLSYDAVTGICNQGDRIG
jgi:hypothetical protein